MRFCGACGAPLGETLELSAADGDGSDAQRRHMTVMFCDLVDSTPLAARLDPEDFRDVLSGYHGVCAHAIEHFNGYVAQYQGDGVVAYFGYPRAHEDDAPRAVHAALEILADVSARNLDVHERYGVELAVRIGLHTGLVVAGEMGSGPARERHAAVGAALHIAARVQTVAPAGAVVLTEPTLALVGGRFETEALGAKDLKGISQPVAVYAVVGPADGASANDGRRPASATPMIDRVKELAPLIDAWEHAQQANGTTVHVAGEAGIGKSRLVGALREHVREQGAERILQCSPHHSNTALHPAISFLERFSDLDRAQPPHRQLETLEACLEGADVSLEEAMPLLGDLLAIPLGAIRAPELRPRDARSATLRLLETLLVGDASKRPLLLVVEDLHWADPTTIELLERIVSDLSSMPVACVLTFRPDFQPPWRRWQLAVDIDLGPLSTPDVRTMASAASPVPLDAEALTRVESAAEGVPLFVEEMAKSIGAEHEPPELTRVPLTLDGLLSERLDRLPELRRLIDLAAVLGPEFDRGLFEALSNVERRPFREALAKLTAEDVLRPVEGSRARLEFRHALLQEVAYDRLLRKRRRTLHAAVAELLVTDPPSALESEPERIAFHWSRAGEPARALPYWKRAARRALKRAAFLEAAEHFREAVNALDATHPAPDRELERGELLTGLGAALQAGATPAANVEVTFAQARSSLAHANARERLVPVIRGEYLLHVTRAQYAAALPLAEELLAMGREGSRTVWVAEGRFYMGFVRMLRGELDAARADLEEAIELYRPSERSEEIFEAQADPGVAAMAYLANLLWNQGYAQRAVERSDESLELAEEVGGPVTLAQAWGMRCGLLLVRGLSSEFAIWLAKARAHSVERNIGYWSDVCSMWSVWAAGLTGDARAATPLLQRHLAGYVDSGGRVGLPHFYALLAEVQLAAGERERALESLSAGQQHIDLAGERYYEPELQWLTARMLEAGEKADLRAAAAAYQRAIAAARGQSAKLLELRAAMGLAINERRDGRDPDAIELVRSLCGWFGSESNVPDVARALALLQEEHAGG